MVREAAMIGTGYFPIGVDDAYAIDKDGLYLAGTSEVALVAMNAGKTFLEAELPRRYVGVSTCFRREAGAAGRDTRGLYRVHQFQKVEQIVISPADPERSAIEHQALLQNAEEILQALELPYRIVAVCTGELGIGQVRKNDIETWMPSRAAYGETHSCSTLHDFQARRLNIRCLSAEGEKKFAHTLNNTAVASPRILIPLLENHQRQDGSIHIPTALRPYLNGLPLIELA
jgi:seryl-tRNA synthetase